MKVKLVFYFYILLLISALIINNNKTQGVKPAEGCQGFQFPPAGHDFFPNFYINETYTKFPDWSIERMKTFVSMFLPRIVNDFPPNYKRRIPGIYQGVGGMSVLLLRVYKNSGFKDKNLLFLAKQYIDVSLKTFPKKYDPRWFSFLKGRTGIVTLASVIYDLIQNDNNNNNYTKQIGEFHKEVNSIFDKVQLTDDTYYDLESGYVGLIYCAKYLKLHFKKDIVPFEKVLKVERFIYEKGMKYYSSVNKTMNFEFYNNHFWTGMGTHGAGSPIYGLLNSHVIQTNETIKQHVRETVDHFLSLQREDGQIPDDLVPERTQWCHGIPGLLPVFGSAYQFYKNDKYFKAIIKGVDFISKKGIITKGSQLCHGLSGNVYMVLDSYKRFKDERFLSVAISMVLSSLQIPQFSSLNIDDWLSYDCLPYSLYASSSMGMVLLFSDILANLNDLSKIKMVGFDFEW